MMLGMTRAKIAVTIPRPLLAAARRAVKRRQSESVSAYVAEAMEQKAKLDDLAALLDEMLAETGGPPTEAERREAERMLGIRKHRRTRAA
jgi:hypothetical protein